MQFAAFLPGHWVDRSVHPHRFYRQMLEQAMLAEKLGFDYVWLAEHHLIDYIAIPDPLQLAAAILERTERLKVGVAVFIAPNHHPLKLAGQIAQMDNMYRGRFLATLGRGASGYEFRQLGINFSEEESRQYFQEHLEVMIKAWRSPVSHAHAGKHFQYNYACLVPPPYTPDLPMWLAALSEGSVKGNVANCVKLGLPVRLFNSPFRQPFSFVESIHGAFTEALAEHKVPRSEAILAVNRVGYVAGSDAEVREMLPTVRNLHRGLVAMLADTEEVVNGRTQLKPVPNEPTDEQMLENTLMGTPQIVRDRVRQYKDLGIDHLSYYTHCGQPHELVVESMRQFGEKILHHFK